MKIICACCRNAVREIEPKDNPKIIQGLCDECYVAHMDLEDLFKHIREAGENPPLEKK